MRKGRDLLGLPIMENGQRLGEVQDLIYNPNEQIVSGFLLDKGSWFHTPRQVTAASVMQVLVDAIKVDNPQIIELNSYDSLVSKLHGRKVKTVGGRFLGSVQDVVLDDTSLQICGLEISDGFISDLVSGRSIIYRHDIITQSDYAVVVGDKLEKIWKDQFRERGH